MVRIKFLSKAQRRFLYYRREIAVNRKILNELYPYPK